MLKKGDLLSGVYEIIQEIGAGGTGVIYLGYHRRLQKQIVIKRIKDNYTGRINVRGEADILKKLHHRYLPQVYDFIVFGQDVYKNHKTVISKEYSVEWCEGMEPYYPVNDSRNSVLYSRYKVLADQEKNVVFGGRLAEYKYYDMDKVISAALDQLENL